MKVNSINNYKFTYECGCGKPKPKAVSFGFGEDYGSDPSLEPEFNRMPENPSTLRTLWLLVEFPAVMLKETIKDAIDIHRKTQQYKAKFKEQERLKKLEGENPSSPDTISDPGNIDNYIDLSA